MTDSDDDMWFAPKRVGYGAGLPIAWQGWVLTIGFVAGVIGLSLWAGHLRRSGTDGAAFAAITLLTVLFAIVARAKTRGGWRWRWGKRR